MISLYLLNCKILKTYLITQIIFIIIRNCRKNLPLIVSVNNKSLNIYFTPICLSINIIYKKTIGLQKKGTNK